MRADLFDDMIGSMISRWILRIDMNSPRSVSAGGVSLRPVSEPSEVAVRHVAVLGAIYKPRHDLGLGMTVHDHCGTQNII